MDWPNLYRCHRKARNGRISGGFSAGKRRRDYQVGLGIEPACDDTSLLQAFQSQGDACVIFRRGPCVRSALAIPKL